MKLTDVLHLLPRLKMSGAITPLPQMPSNRYLYFTPAPKMLVVLPFLNVRLNAPQHAEGTQWFRIIHFRFSECIYVCS
jgi:hypothetical protein